MKHIINLIIRTFRILTSRFGLWLFQKSTRKTTQPFKKSRKKHGVYDLREEVAVWVKKNIGAEYVNEALDKYDKINSGVPIGGFQETAAFLHMIEQIKKEALT